MNAHRPPLLHSCPALVTGPYRGGITTRVGFPAASEDPREDARTRETSRRILATALRRDLSQLCWLLQVHGPDVLDATEKTGFLGEADALVSTDPRRILLVSVADCGPVLLWDDRAKVHAAVHAGWRGTLAGILENTIASMRDRHATLGHVHAWIGPSIGIDHFEVGPEVAEQFDSRDVRPPAGPERPRPHVDLRSAIWRRLLDAGLDEKNLRISRHCTYAQPDLYWSYRRDRGICGRHLAFLTGPDPG